MHERAGIGNYPCSVPRTRRQVINAVDGFVREPGGAAWQQARFALGDGAERSVLHVQTPSDPDATDIDLHQVTALDELRSDVPDHDVVELAVEREPRLEAAWPPGFTALVLGALRSTVEDGSPTDVAEVPERRSGMALTGTIAALGLIGVGALIVGAVTLDTDPPPVPTDSQVVSTTIAPPTTRSDNRTTQAPSTEAPTTSGPGTGGI
jgi:hypothetical protein